MEKQILFVNFMDLVNRSLYFQCLVKIILMIIMMEVLIETVICLFERDQGWVRIFEIMFEFKKKICLFRLCLLFVVIFIYFITYQFLYYNLYME